MLLTVDNLMDATVSWKELFEELFCLISVLMIKKNFCVYFCCLFMIYATKKASFFLHHQLIGPEVLLINSSETFSKQQMSLDRLFCF